MRRRIVERKVVDGSVSIDDIVFLPTEKVRNGSKYLFIVFYRKTESIRCVFGTELNGETDWKPWKMQNRCSLGAVES